VTHKRVFPIPGPTGSHHAIITLDVPLRSYIPLAKPFMRSLQSLRCLCAPETVRETQEETAMKRLAALVIADSGINQ
jgi:hypothetical protein